MLDVQWVCVLIPDNLHVVPLEVGMGDVVLVRVGPEQLIGDVGDGEGVGPPQGRVDDDPLVRTVHPRLADVRLVPPVRPVHVAVVRIQHNSSRILETGGDQGLPVLPIELGNLDGIFALVTPVQVTAHPVQRYAVRALNGGVENHRLTIIAHFLDG